MSKAELWQQRVGLPPHAVTVYERAEKEGVLYLRWRAGGNWKKRALGVTLRDERGRVRPEIKRMALAEAERQYELLAGKRSPAAKATAPLTIARTWTIISDPQTGRYPVPTRYREEVVKRELANAGRIWGETTEWNAIDRTRLRALGRTRVDEIRKSAKKREQVTPRTGYRGAEVTVATVIAIATFLRDEGLIAIEACLAPKSWKNDLREYWRQVTPNPAEKPARPRHTVDEMRAILGKAAEVDPRFHLLLILGADLRLGQVVRARRSDVNVEQKTLMVRGAGNKRGTVVDLTPAQWTAFERAIGEGGYLEDCERECRDYPLFPASKLRAGKALPSRVPHWKTLHRRTIAAFFLKAEELAKVPHVAGRTTYGLRRVHVDAAKELGISREGLQQLGGWTTTDVPDQIYADQEMSYARKEAATIRAKIRGETNGD